jgi:mannosyl-glycoprotein endo-beta-N-acetylglucosaminidase
MAQQGSTSSTQPQLLVCHDMRGGYLDYEVLLAGSTDAKEYRIWHWDCVDVFVYFSHHMVTIPPKGWIHAAHKHGVKVSL